MQAIPLQASPAVTVHGSSGRLPMLALVSRALESRHVDAIELALLADLVDGVCADLVDGRHRLAV